MAKQRQRRQPPPGEFEDPLSNYDAPDYADAFERSLCEDPVLNIAAQPPYSVELGQSIREVLRVLADNDIAAVTVVDADRKPVGIVSERDVLMRIADVYDALAERPVETVMTANPVVVNETDLPGRVLNLMGTHQFRHLPVVDVDGRLIGMIGAHRLLTYLQSQISA